MTADTYTLEKATQCRAYPPPGAANKMFRLIWNIVNTTIYAWIPTPLYAPRRAILRLFGARIDPLARPYPGARIWAPWNLEMASASCIANGANCYNVATITLGAGATVSQRAFLCTPSHDIRRRDFALVAADIVIEENAWIAAEAFVGPGVRIGQNAVIGARCVVNSNVPANTVVAGNPARIIGSRQIKDRL